MSVYPNNRITLNLTTVNAVRPLRGRYYLHIHTASSASLHMRLSNVGRLRRPAAHCCHPKGLRMNPIDGLSRRNMPPITWRKATFCTAKDGLLQNIGNQHVTRLNACNRIFARHEAQRKAFFTSRLRPCAHIQAGRRACARPFPGDAQANVCYGNADLTYLIRRPPKMPLSRRIAIKFS